ncbi:hypothetical protein COJ85_30030 [Bacillus sp. AFS076308]|uniref:hypothetical protein n=1 Tax=Bacillus sp. AFS076308 TaxID=2033512 RepID=UPI000BF7A486|nr:hypothetical protein [Bacillus sp. AFS076308]PFN80652.1 hypothetical protein COJ85_30030 [Bacillus sp. AFS076308]
MYRFEYHGIYNSKTFWLNRRHLIGWRFFGDLNIQVFARLQVLFCDYALGQAKHPNCIRCLRPDKELINDQGGIIRPSGAPNQFKLGIGNGSRGNVTAQFSYTTMFM